MTPAALIAKLATRGVEFQAFGDKLRFRPADRITSQEVAAIRRHKQVILKLLRAEGIVCRHPAADPRPLSACDRCDSTEYKDVSIHDGQSLRRECIHCRRFLGWPRWNGSALFEKGDTETRHED